MVVESLYPLEAMMPESGLLHISNLTLKVENQQIKNLIIVRCLTQLILSKFHAKKIIPYKKGEPY